MTITEARQAVYRAFYEAVDRGEVGDGADFLVAHGDNYTFDAEPFTEPPPRNPPTGQTPAAWIRVAVRHQQQRQDTLGSTGNRLFQQRGMVLAQVFTAPPDNGAFADALSHSVAQVFSAKRLKQVEFEAATTQEQGVQGRWYMTLVETPFRYYNRA